MKTTGKHYGFTLIEMLVVIAIIGLLAALLFPAVTAALNTAKETKAKATAQNIESAIMVYMNEYNGKLPTDTYGTDGDIDDPENDSKDILKVLMAINSAPNNGNRLNPQRIVFLETDVPSTDGTYLDPWGTQYKILLDGDLDNSIEYLSGALEHRKRAVVVSAGKNELFGPDNTKNTLSEDNIANVDLPQLD